MKPAWRNVLQHRSEADKIGVSIDCDMAPVGELNVVAELVREGVIIWIDRAALTHLVVKRQGGRPFHPNVDVYRLTAKGIALCDAEGIERK